MAKYIFLDIDGVMSSSGHKKVQNSNNFKIKLNQSAVNALNIILDRVKDAKIIITSTYKRSMIIGEIRHNFVEQGVIDRVIKATPNDSSRDLEITRALSSTRDKVEGFLVLDDLEILGFDEHFLQIHGGTLSEKDIEKCIDILNKDVSNINFKNLSQVEKSIKNGNIDSGMSIDTLLGDEVNQYKGNNTHNVVQSINDKPKINRNEPCPCGSGKKYKKCCLNS